MAEDNVAVVNKDDGHIHLSKAMKRVAWSSFLGNFIEWFDFGTYTYFAIIIGEVFFPEAGANSTLWSFAVFGLAFLFRPLGAAFWGSMGDKKGRKTALSISIIVVAAAAFAIGCIPSYAVIGIGAPILLLICRTVQAFSVAGEYSGSAVFIGEYAPSKHRGLYCAITPASTAIGLLVGSTIALILKATCSDASLIAWAWRVPFWIAGPLGLIAHYIRTKLEEAPVYQNEIAELTEKHETVHPTKTVFKKYSKRLIVSIGVTMLNAVGWYLVLTYPPTYLELIGNATAAGSQALQDIILLIYIGLIFASGAISDRFGRKKMLSIAAVLFLLFTIPAFMLMNSSSMFIIFLGELILCLCLCLNDGNIACYQAEMFPTEVRYTGAALGSNLAYVVFGGTASFVATALISSTGNPISPAYYMMAVALVALLVMIMAKDYTGIELSDIK